MSQELPKTAPQPFLTSTMITAFFTWLVLLLCMDAFIILFPLDRWLIVGMTLLPHVPLIINIVTKRLMVMDLESILFHQRLYEDRHRQTLIAQQLVKMAERDEQVAHRIDELFQTLTQEEVPPHESP